MNMRDYYEKLDPYDLYNKKDVVNAYKHGEYDALDKVIEIIDRVGERSEVGDIYEFEMFTEIREGVLALKGEQD